MIKMVEIYSLPKAYDAELETCKSAFSLREIYVNPRHIIMMREDEAMTVTATKSDVIPGMTKSAKFTEVLLSTPGGRVKSMTVVEDMKNISTMCAG
tara:strand:+ start:140 stop:427 length:288 start_codon:yes stop_codon:yes gene_type:complete